MTVDEGRKPEGVPERSPKAGGGAPAIRSYTHEPFASQ